MAAKQVDEVSALMHKLTTGDVKKYGAADPGTKEYDDLVHEINPNLRSGHRRVGDDIPRNSRGNGRDRRGRRTELPSRRTMFKGKRISEQVPTSGTVNPNGPNAGKENKDNKDNKDDKKACEFTPSELGMMANITEENLKSVMTVHGSVYAFVFFSRQEWSLHRLIMQSQIARVATPTKGAFRFPAFDMTKKQDAEAKVNEFGHKLFAYIDEFTKEVEKVNHKGTVVLVGEWGPYLTTSWQINLNAWMFDETWAKKPCVGALIASVKEVIMDAEKKANDDIKKVEAAKLRMPTLKEECNRLLTEKEKEEESNPTKSDDSAAIDTKKEEKMDRIKKLLAEYNEIKEQCINNPQIMRENLQFRTNTDQCILPVLAQVGLLLTTEEKLFTLLLPDIRIDSEFFSFHFSLAVVDQHVSVRKSYSDQFTAHEIKKNAEMDTKEFITAVKAIQSRCQFEHRIVGMGIGYSKKDHRYELRLSAMMSHLKQKPVVSITTDGKTTGSDVKSSGSAGVLTASVTTSIPNLSATAPNASASTVAEALSANAMEKTHTTPGSKT